MKYDLIEALKQIERERGISLENLLEALESALISAYKKKYGPDKNIKIEVDKVTGNLRMFKLIEGEDIESSEKEIVSTPSDFGRIAAQTVKQILQQKIREASREIMYKEFKDMIGEVMTGIIRQTDQRFTLVDLGRAEALLPQGEQIPREHYRLSDRIKCYIVNVKKTSRGPQVIVSRTHPGLIRRLFELEVPEISDGIVEINNVAREPGYRSKISVSSNNKSIDPVGACVGQRGSRVKMVVGELGGERVDIIKYSNDMAEYVRNALSPSKVSDVFINKEEKKAYVIVPDDQVSLAIGKDGHNARLAAKLTNWKIDIKSESMWAEEKLKELEKKKGKKEKIKEEKGIKRRVKVVDKKKAKVVSKKGVKKKVKEKKAKRCKAKLTNGTRCTYASKTGSDYCGLPAHKKLETKKEK